MIKEIPSTAPQRFNFKLLLLLWVMGTLGAIAVVPYLLILSEPLLETQRRLTNQPIEGIIAGATIVQYSLYSLIAAALGVALSRRIGLGAPILERLIQRESVLAPLRKILPVSIAAGVAGALVIALLDFFVFAPLLRAELGERLFSALTPTLRPSPFFGLLASFEGGIVEELLLRFFLLSLFAWLGSFISHTPEHRPTLAVLWTANILTALLFGLGHLPATQAAGLPLTTLVITRALVLNGLLGLTYGFLYWTRGLESAMLAHFSSDVILHVVLAFLT